MFSHFLLLSFLDSLCVVWAFARFEVPANQSGFTILGLAEGAQNLAEKMESKQSGLQGSGLSCPHHQLPAGLLHALCLSVCPAYMLAVSFSNMIIQVVQDEKYLQRIKWQYIVLDEAQAIKSSSRYVLGRNIIVCFHTLIR